MEAIMKRALIVCSATLLLGLLVTGVRGAGKGTAQAGPAGAGGKTVGISLSCELNKTGQALKVSYTLHNGGAERIYVLDQMVAARSGGFVQTPEALIIQQEAPSVAALIRGFVDPGHPVQFQYAPGARALDPGQSLTGSAEAPLPLRAQHPYGRPVPLQGKAESIVLRIGYLSGQVEWTQHPLQGGGSLTAPTLAGVRGQRFARCARPLP
jgi:hypothetical protein